MRLWVLLFNTDSDNQGIYTRLEGEKNIVLAFAQEDDAIRYAGLLEAQDFPSAVTESIDQKELTEICDDTGLGLNIVGTEELAIPPVQNVEETDWQIDQKPSDQKTSAADLSFESFEIEMMRRKLEGLL
jgi:hypothetical protein